MKQQTHEQLNQKLIKIFPDEENNKLSPFISYVEVKNEEKLPVFGSAMEPLSAISRQEDHERSTSSINQKKSYSIDHIQSQEMTDFILGNKQHTILKQENSKEVQLSLFREGNDDDSDEEQQKVVEEQIKENIRKNRHIMKADQKMVVGTGFTFDMTDFFKFKKKEEMKSDQKGENTFLSEISGSRIAWLILLYTVTSSAMIPGWIMNIKATKLLRQCWRFLMQALMVIPFVLHEKRTLDIQNKEKYTLKYIFNMKNLIKPYVSSLSSSLWFLLVLSSFQWTYVSHGIVLGSLSNFFLSIGRSMRKASHDLESGGQMLVMFGIVFVMYDSYSLNTQTIALEQFDNINIFYLSRAWWERIGGDIVAIFTSLMMSQFSKYTSDLRSYYPPFLSMLLVNSFNFFNIGLITFFFNGATFDFDPYWGFFSILTDKHFTSFMYMAIVLAFGQMVSVLMITRMFPDPIIPALAMTLQPFIACLIVHLANIQNLPGDFAMIGFIFIFPGLLTVLMGQCFHQRQKASTQQTDKRVKQLLDEIKRLQEVNQRKQSKVRMTRMTRMNQSLVMQNNNETKRNQQTINPSLKKQAKQLS